MHVITKTALSNFRKNKSRNLLIGIAILLTALLLTAVPVTVFGMLDLERVTIKETYPAFHVMFRNVGEETAAKLQKDDALAEVGFREDPARVYDESGKASIGMVYADDNTCKLNRMQLKEGRVPEKFDEIVVSRGMLKILGLEGEIGSRIQLPVQADEGDGYGMAVMQEFTIVGFSQDSKVSDENASYSVMISKKYAEQIMPQGKHVYRVYAKLADAQGKTTDELEAEIAQLGEDYQISRDNVVANTEYLTAAFVDPVLYAGVAALLAVIVLAGMLTTYSIYYVSMMDKVREYGKLRAIGATKRQIRKLVFREGFAVAAIAVPLGMLAGTLIGVLILKGMVHSGINSENMVAEQMKGVLAAGEVSLVKGWILLLAAATSLLTVYLALLRPMKKASRISSIEAIRFQETGGRRKKQRKGYQELSPGKLTLTNLGRNRRRTVVTICTLGVTGIFFMAVATLLSCMNPKVMAADEIRGNIEVSIESWEEDMMNPERMLRNIQKNNPLTDEFRKQIQNIDGVKEVDEQLFANAKLLDDRLTEEDGSPFNTGIGGMSKAAMKEVEKYVEAGSLSDERLYDGTGIILGKGYITKYSDIDVGDTIQVEIEDGETTFTKEFVITARTNAPNGLTGNSLFMPAEVLQSFCERNLTYTYHITTKQAREQEIADILEPMIAPAKVLEMKTYGEVYKMGEMTIGYIRYAGYGLLLVLGLIGILNLINTMINSVYARRKELGMLQAIGLSGRQLVGMLQLEGLFYTAGTLLLSLGAGSAVGYALFLWAKQDGMFSIKTYSYPAVPALILALIILVVQLLITYLVNHSFKKVSLIDRIRFAE